MTEDNRMTLPFLRTETVIFHPTTVEEAGFLQKRLFELGLTWKDGSTTVQDTEVLSHGSLVVRDGMMGWKRIRYYEDNATMSRIENLPLTEEEVNTPKPFNVSPVMGGRQMTELFAKMAKRITELEDRVEDLEAEMKGDEVHISKLPVTDHRRGADKGSRKP